MRREPLLHFLLLGAALFAVHRAFFWHPPRRIVVTPEFVEGLRRDARAKSGHLLSAAEESQLVEQFIDDEILYREALSLGLDRGDLIVRRRLVQKMELLAGANAALPSERELDEYFAAHRERYVTPPRVSLHQVFTRGEVAPLERALANGSDWQKVGEPFSAGQSWTGRSESELAAIFGGDLAQVAMQAPPGQFLAERRARRDGQALAELRARYTVERR